jgi:enoyl-CoA hydratase
MFNISHLGRVAVVEMAYGKVNAMDLKFCRGLSETLLGLERNGSTSAVVLTSGVAIFSPGLDLKRIVREGSDYLSQSIESLDRCLRGLCLFSKPLVAAINGHAVAGGCAMALACDYRILGEQATIGMPESRLGVPFPAIAIEVIRGCVSPSTARSMLQLGKTFVGEAAIQVGLVDEVISNHRVLDQATAKAAEFAQLPPEVFVMTKRQLQMPTMLMLEESERKFGRQVRKIWSSDTLRESIEEFVRERLS